MHICIYTYIHICIYTYIHIYIYTYIHIYIYTYYYYNNNYYYYYYYYYHTYRYGESFMVILGGQGWACRSRSPGTAAAHRDSAFSMQGIISYI